MMSLIFVTAASDNENGEDRPRIKEEPDPDPDTELVIEQRVVDRGHQQPSVVPSASSTVPILPQSNVSLTTGQGRGRFNCITCGKFYRNRSGLCRHQRLFHKVRGDNNENARGMCRFCGILCLRENVASHEKSCGSKVVLRRRQYCTVDGCGISFFRKEELIDHLKAFHNEVIEPMRRLVFNSEDDFKTWKEKEEDQTFSFYSKHTGTKKGCDTFYCQHDGSSRVHRRDPNSHIKTKQNKKGRIKEGKTCISFIRIKRFGNTLTVHYWPTHSHPLSEDDVKHHPLSESTYQFIKEQINLNIPCRQIQAAVRKKLAESEDARVRDTHVTLKRINSLAKRIRATSQASHNDDEALSRFVDALIAQDDSPIILYKPACLNILSKESAEDREFYFLGVQSEDQQKMLQREVTMPMFIGVVNGPHTFNNYLISVVVPCENNFEYPVGHLITSHMNVEAICLFLQAIGERCPNLNVNCIIFEDYPELSDSIKQVFGDDGPYFLSKWHFLKSARRAVSGLAPENMVEEIYDFILAMADAETEDRFLLLYNTFREQFDETAPNVVSLVGNFITRAVSWASCYRQYPGIIDSSLYVDSFHNKLRKLYRRRPMKTPNLLLDLLLSMQEDYKEKRATILENDINITLLEEQHSASLEMSANFVQGTLYNHWSVTGSKNGQEFSVMQCLPRCDKGDCKLLCKDCGILCSHMYYCTCTTGRTVCKHIHKVHSENCTILQLEGLCDIALDTDSAKVDDCENPPKEMEVDNADNSDHVSLVDHVDNADSNVSMNSKLSILEHIESLKSFVEQDTCSDDALNLIRCTLSSLVTECHLVSQTS